MRLKLIACEIFYRELCAAVARSVNQVDVEFLPKGLHDIGQAGMSARLAEVLAAVDESKYDAVLLRLRPVQQRPGGPDGPEHPAGHSPRARLHHALPRQQGAIPRLLPDASRRLLQDQRLDRTRRRARTSTTQDSIQHQAGMTQTYEELVAKYGEDNAKFLYEQLCNMTRNYSGHDVHRDGHRAGRPFRAAGPRSKRPSGAGSSRNSPAT